MSSNNYGVFGKKFSLEGAFRVLRIETFPSENLDHEDVTECGVLTVSSDLKTMMSMATSLRFVDFGNGLMGLYAECAEFHFCVVPEDTQDATTEPKPGFHLENSDKEDIF
jgi:hypothetical protein